MDIIDTIVCIILVLIVVGVYFEHRRAKRKEVP
jgi:hypothetical protein